MFISKIINNVLFITKCKSRQSLLSVLQQMLIEDIDDSVRATTIKSIAINSIHIYDTDKYAQVNTTF